MESERRMEWKGRQRKVKKDDLSFFKTVFKFCVHSAVVGVNVKMNENVQIEYAKNDATFTQSSLHESQSACPKSEFLTLELSPHMASPSPSPSPKNGTRVRVPGPSTTSLCYHCVNREFAHHLIMGPCVNHLCGRQALSMHEA
jgi:hypothetical protein